MRALIQRVSSARVTVDTRVVGEISLGLVVLVGVIQDDNEADVVYLADKIPHMRIFPDGTGRFDRSCLSVGGSLLLVSQFTLYADTSRGRRPSFSMAAPPERAEILIGQLGELLRKAGLRVETGIFRSDMRLELVNDGPVTIMLDTDDRGRPRKG